jgi:hypothetical protein
MTEINTNQINLAPIPDPEWTEEKSCDIELREKLFAKLFGNIYSENNKYRVPSPLKRKINDSGETVIKKIDIESQIIFKTMLGLFRKSVPGKRVLEKKEKTPVKKSSTDKPRKKISLYMMVIKKNSSFFNDYQYNKYLRFIRWFASSFRFKERSYINTNENESRINKFIGRTYLSDCGSDKRRQSLLSKKEERKQKGGISKVLLRYNNALFDAICLHCKYA